uniref:ATP-dependent DNA helicase n=1 Tax=Brassica oleracea var. oleracea TaxID=109376 RepID=A0A0D2ZX74_BRAOL
MVQASLTSSVLWKSCKVLSLTKNMRLTVDSDPAEAESIKEFSEWILKLGDGKLSEPNDGEAVIDIPDDMLLMDSLDPITSITNATYPSLIEHMEDEFFSKIVLYYVPQMMLSMSDKRDEDVTVEFLNSIKCAGVPNHVLKLRKGVPVMLLRNIDQKCGLVNGTRLQ